MVESPVTSPLKATFEFGPTASPFIASPQAYLTEPPDSRFAYLATGAHVFDTTEHGAQRILLLQRSACDSNPNRWEVPGGACDEDDQSILHAVARELWEETGLKARYIGQQIGNAHIFVSRSGKKIGKFHFLVGVERDATEVPKVRLDPQEHQQYVWATQDEIKVKQAGTVELEFTSDNMADMILRSFACTESLGKNP